jgi:hypothetical protein
MDAWLLWFNASFWTWLFDLVPWIQARANDTESWANQASQSATTAGLTANALVWNPSTNYALGQNAISPTNFQTYRRRVAGVSATDPVSDATNWTAVAAVPDESVTAAKLAPNSITLLNWSNTNGQLAGTRNLLINANFQPQSNQRGYVSGTNTTQANQFTFDRWFIPTSGQNLTFTASGNGNIVTAPASGLTQVIEGVNIGGGNYVINWTGTATCTVNGTARTKGETFTLLAGVNCVVRFSGGTLSQPQLEPGQFATPFEHRDIGDELRRCQRYYETSYNTGVAPGAVSASTWLTSAQATSNYLNINGGFATPKRGSPAFTAYSPGNGAVGFASVDGVNRAVTVAANEKAFRIRIENISTTVDQFMTVHWTASAELTS